MNLRPEQTEEIEINLTSLIDVVFLLLIFFMVTTTFERQAKLRVTLPAATPEATTAAVDRRELVIGADGGYFFDGNSIVASTTEALAAALAPGIGNDLSQAFVIRADANTPHQAVVRAMDAAGQLGLANLSIATTPQGGSDD